MSLDIIEIALEKMTDATEFEKLATEIMYHEGFGNIIPLPGGNDFGQDAIEDKFYASEDSANRTVFQYSLQGYAKGKIKKTVARLIETGNNFSELVYVTNRSITGEKQEEIRKEFRAEYKKPLTIYEKETIVNRLSDTSNGLFVRHFPDIEKQIAALKSNKPIISNNEEKNLEIALLKVSIAFTFNKDAAKTRKDIFDNLILSIIYSSEENKFSFEEILINYQKSIDSTFNQNGKLKAALDRLTREKKVDCRDGMYSLTELQIKSLEAKTIAVNNETKDLYEFIISEVARISKSTLSKQDQDRIRKNSIDVLLELFKMYGLDLCDQFLNKNQSLSLDISKREHFVQIAKNGLSKALGDLIVATIGQIFKNPNKNHAEIIANLAKSYLGVKLMSLDPHLKELQHVQLSKKIFILDTDFLLNCIITERPLHKNNLALVNELINLGCNVIIPVQVFDECISHASYAINSYNYFRSALHGLTEEVVDSEVHNLFVQGYYYYYRDKKYSFNSYISNYYNADAPQRFFRDMLYDVLPEEVEIVDLTEKYNIKVPIDELEKLENVIFENLLKSPKARHRTKEQTKDLASNDAKLFLCCHHLNRTGATDKRILGGKAYLLTFSTRYLFSAKAAGIKDVITVKPQSLSSLLEIIGVASNSPVEFVKLMDNPLLIQSVQDCWDDIELLVKSGIDLNGKNLPRLRWDLDEKLHQHISAYEIINDQPDSDRPYAADEKLESFANLIGEANKLGYNSVPYTDKIVELIKNKDSFTEDLLAKFEEKSQQYESLAKELQRLGKRKQHYLNRISKKK